MLMDALLLEGYAVGEDDELADHFYVLGGLLVSVIEDSADCDVIAGAVWGGHGALYDYD